MNNAAESFYSEPVSESVSTEKQRGVIMAVELAPSTFRELHSFCISRGLNERDVINDAVRQLLNLD